MALLGARTAGATLSAIIACCSAVTLSGCYEPLVSEDGSGDGDGDGDECIPPDPEVAVTYAQDIAPILRTHCETCHRDGGIAPMPLSTYEEVVPWADAIVLQTSAQAMPPWPSLEDENCAPPGPWKNDSRLTPEELELLAEWADSCTVESDGGAPADLDPFPSLDLENPDKVVVIPAPTTIPPLVEKVNDKNIVNPDQFYCFIMDLELATDEVLVASQVTPGNTKVNHHALMYLVSDSAALSALDTQDAMDGATDGRFECVGGPGVSSTLINAWVPGQSAFEIPHEAGMSIPAGSQVVMQVHYHPAEAQEIDDATSISMRFADATPMRTAFLQLIGNDTMQYPDGTGLQPGTNDPMTGGPVFLIPAEEEEHWETMAYRVPALPGGGDLRLAAIAGHMHFVGTKLQIELKDSMSASEDQCLLQLDWDFDWQRFYTYDLDFGDLPLAKEGDFLRLRCGYNNTQGNPDLAVQLEIAGEEDPIDVTLGEGSLDEMCLGAYLLISDP